MAVEFGLNHVLSYPASTDLSSYQYRAVTIDSNGQLAVATAAKNIDGILQDKPAAQGRAGLVQWGGQSKATAGGNFSIGGLLEVGTSGKLVALASGTAVAKALEAGSDGKIVSVKLLQSNAAYA